MCLTELLYCINLSQFGFVPFSFCTPAVSFRFLGFFCSPWRKCFDFDRFYFDRNNFVQYWLSLLLTFWTDKSTDEIQEFGWLCSRCEMNIAATWVCRPPPSNSFLGNKTINVKKHTWMIWDARLFVCPKSHYLLL